LNLYQPLLSHQPGGYAPTPIQKTVQQVHFHLMVIHPRVCSRCGRNRAAYLESVLLNMAYLILVLALMRRPVVQVCTDIIILSRVPARFNVSCKYVCTFFMCRWCRYQFVITDGSLDNARKLHLCSPNRHTQAGSHQVNHQS